MSQAGLMNPLHLFLHSYKRRTVYCESRAWSLDGSSPVSSPYSLF